MISIRPSTLEDQQALEALLQLVWNGHQSATAYHGRGRRPGLVAQVSGEVIGYGVTWHSQLHPTHTYVGIHIHPHWRGRGLGAELWRQVTAGVTGSLKSATSADQVAARSFLERRGLRVSVETHEPCLLTADLPDFHIMSWVREAARLGFELRPMTALSSENLTVDLTHLHREVYAYSHLHDPASVSMLDEDDFLGDDLVPDWLYVALKDDVLAGISSVRLDDPLPMLGWFGVTWDFAAVGRELTLALTGLAIQAARERVPEITAELDSADPNAMHLRREFPWQVGRIWLTFTSIAP